MIDTNTSDMSCVYSTVRCVAAECRRHRLKPIFTFDQRLWWKAQLIIANEPSGSNEFHTEVIFCVLSWHMFSGQALAILLLAAFFYLYKLTVCPAYIYRYLLLLFGELVTTKIISVVILHRLSHILTVLVVPYIDVLRPSVTDDFSVCTKSNR